MINRDGLRGEKTLCGGKLSADQVREIKAGLANSEKQAYLAALYGVSGATISRIKTGARWGWLE